jgi:hypothetical protein
VYALPTYYYPVVDLIVIIQMKVPFTLDGPNGVLQHLEHLIETKGFALICIAEGAGQVRLHSHMRYIFFGDFTDSVSDLTRIP